jgi:[histone H3]-lysine27 N-trimethyltransferase EZH2
VQGEYTGELLTNEECERRGAVYDRRDTSYLFSLNDKWVIDAQKVGNKLRFANHKKNANAQARVMMLGGDHHVGIYAKTNLPAGTEIFYDYGYGSGRGAPFNQHVVCGLADVSSLLPASL